MIALETDPTATRSNVASAARNGDAPDAARNAMEPTPTPSEGELAAYTQIASRLHSDADRLFSLGRYRESEQRVRQLLSLQQKFVGQRHADFALGLSMLGELRFVQDDQAAAE